MLRNSVHLFAAALALGLGLAFARPAQAHFIWLVPQSGAVQIYFGEEAAPDDPDLLKYVEGVQAWQVRPGQQPMLLEIARAPESLSVKLPDGGLNGGLLFAAHDLGVMNRGDAVFRLKYFAKAGPAAGMPAWTEVDCSKYLPLDIVPTVADGQVRVQVRFEGKPIAGAQVVAIGPGLEDFEGQTDAQGQAAFALADAGRYSIRARYIEEKPGELNGKKYTDIRYYTTVALDVPANSSPAVHAHLQPLEQPVTSFGGAILGGDVYIYGGHTGDAHSYSNEEQDHFVRRLDLQTGKWKKLAAGPHLQGLALVAHGGKLYRIGGFTAKNADGEDHDLWSQADVASYDPKTNEWTELSPLPEPRSSFDAAVLGDTIYVIGGWKMAGDAERVWHETAWAMDLSAASPEWRALPKPPFQRRALAVAAHNGKIYAIGGMQSEGGITTRVDVFDPQAGAWSQGPSLVTEKADADESSNGGSRRRPFSRMTGFGASAFATGGRLYVSTINGDLQQLSDDGSKWTIASKTPTARFFHRMLPIDDERFVIVGGANMSIGKFSEVEILPVTAASGE